MDNEKKKKHKEQGRAQENVNGQKANSDNSSLVPIGSSERAMDEWTKRNPFAVGMLQAQEECKVLESPESAKQLSVSRTCEYLESGQLPAKWINQEKLYQCVMLWESRAYTESMIAKILGKSPRTIRRYSKEIREMDASYEGGNFKVQFLKNLARRWDARVAYFIHLANDKTATSAERFQAMKEAHGIDRDLVNVVAKFLKD